MTIVFKVCEKTMERMQKFYRHKLREKTPPYAIFQAQEEDTIITLYQSGKVMFQGNSADVDASVWKAYEAKISGKEVVDNITKDKQKDSKEKKERNPKYYYATTIGSDEVGTGDFFGPLVITAAYVTKEQIPFLEDLKVKDSKKLTDIQIKSIVPKLIKQIPYDSLVISPKEYNHYQALGHNMNAIKAIGHNKVLGNMLQKQETYDYIVVDQFTYPKSYFGYLKESNHIVKNITFMTKAEDQVLSVACASLISRYIFLKEMEKLKQDLGMEVPKGAGSIVDQAGIEIVKKYGKEKLKDISKQNFKNTEKILNNLV